MLHKELGHKICVPLSNRELRFQSGGDARNERFRCGNVDGSRELRVRQEECGRSIGQRYLQSPPSARFGLGSVKILLSFLVTSQTCKSTFVGTPFRYQLRETLRVPRTIRSVQGPESKCSFEHFGFSQKRRAFPPL